MKTTDKSLVSDQLAEDVKTALLKNKFEHVNDIIKNQKNLIHISFKDATEEECIIKNIFLNRSVEMTRDLLKIVVGFTLNSIIAASTPFLLEREEHIKAKAINMHKLL